MSTVFEQIHQLMDRQTKSVLARIIRHAGSAPRTTGTQCLVLEDGSIIGTIGGGLLEYQVCQRAKDVFQTGKSAILNYRMTGKELVKSEMLCGGTADIYLDPIFPDNPIIRNIFRKIHNLIKDGQKGVLLTVIDSGTGGHDTEHHMLVDESGERTGVLSGYGNAAFWEEDRSPTEQVSTLLTPIEDRPPVFSEPILPDDILFLFGAGHVSVFVASLASLVGFKVIVIDDRAEFANAERFEKAEAVIVHPFDDVFAHISVNAAAYVVIVTRGHVHDRDVLRQALVLQPKYIGMIGSRRKRKIIYDSLLAEGVTQKALDRVHSPIGLDIGAVTPEEISISIVAELIAERAKHRGEKGG